MEWICWIHAAKKQLRRRSYSLKVNTCKNHQYKTYLAAWASELQQPFSKKKYLPRNVKIALINLCQHLCQHLWMGSNNQPLHTVMLLV